MDWSTTLKIWKVHVQIGDAGNTQTFYTRFIALGTGYYDYAEVSTLTLRDPTRNLSAKSAGHYSDLYLNSSITGSQPHNSWA